MRRNGVALSMLTKNDILSSFLTDLRVDCADVERRVSRCVPGVQVSPVEEQALQVVQEAVAAGLDKMNSKSSNCLHGQ